MTVLGMAALILGVTIQVGDPNWVYDWCLQVGLLIYIEILLSLGLLNC